MSLLRVRKAPAGTTSRSPVNVELTRLRRWAAYGAEGSESGRVSGPSDLAVQPEAMNARNAGDVGRNRWSGLRSLMPPASHRGHTAVMEPCAERFRRHAEHCEANAAPLYAVLLRAFADDWQAGGPVARICAGWQDAPAGAVVQLRLLGGLHRLVLSGGAPGLEPYYRSVGGTAGPDGAWPEARRVLTEHIADLRAGLDVAPQTNETGRSVALAAGLAVAAERHRLDRVRLLEVGASAGLNLLVDAFRIEGRPGGRDWTWGPSASAVRIPDAVHGEAAGPASRPAVVARRGCDLEPVGAGSAAGRLRLRSFVWPDHVERFARLEGALAIAAADPPAVDRAAAATWLGRQLAGPAEPGVLTVVWHSIFRQYLDPVEDAALRAVIGTARDRMPLAHVMLESTSAPYLSGPQLVLDDEPLGDAPPHGVPLRLG